MERDFFFSSLVKSSFQIFGPHTEIEYFVLVKENVLYLKLDSENWNVIFMVRLFKIVIKNFWCQIFLKFVHKVNMFI